ncbi:MAG: sulfatase-like hydrolase/transferase [Akkermansiaceae bacterium]|nr:sulfatase-like hydrolase/transferase [Akkermansiaceae bacterium]
MKPFLVILSLLPILAAPLAGADRPPNIVLIMVDDLGYGDLGCYGAPDLRTPHIDALFAAGMRFDEFYANCPVCSPTRASLMTGLYPDFAGVPGVIRTPQPDRPSSWGHLRDTPALPAVLGAAGYHTALVGKWHLGLEAPNRPTDRGFDHFHGWLGDMMDDYYTHRRHGINYMRRGTATIEPEGHATDLFSQWAGEYIAARASGHPNQPFFLYLAYNAPHTPIQPPEDWFRKVKAREAGITDARARLVALIEHMDHGIGRVMEVIREHDLAGETLVVFTSDNGGQSNVAARNAPLRGGKQEMWEGGLRVGTCATWPGTIAAGSRSAYRGITMDLYPTLAEVAGATVPHPVHGRSFLPVLLGKSAELPPRDLVWVRLEGGRKYGGLPYHAIRRGDFKLLRNTPFEPYQLFNLAEDPGEEHPIPEAKARRTYNDLFNALMLHINHAGRVPWQRAEP